MKRLFNILLFAIAIWSVWSVYNSDEESLHDTSKVECDLPTYELVENTKMLVNGYEINIGKGVVVAVDTMVGSGEALCKLGSKTGTINSKYLAPTTKNYAYSYPYLNNPTWNGFLSKLKVFFTYVWPFIFLSLFFRWMYVDKLAEGKMVKLLDYGVFLSLCLAFVAFYYAYGKATGRSVFEDLAAYNYVIKNKWLLLVVYITEISVLCFLLATFLAFVKIRNHHKAAIMATVGVYMTVSIGFHVFSGVFPIWGYVLISSVFAVWFSASHARTLLHLNNMCPVCHYMNCMEQKVAGKGKNMQDNGKQPTGKKTSDSTAVTYWLCRKCGAEWAINREGKNVLGSDFPSWRKLFGGDRG